MSRLSDKIQQHEVTPPANAWSKIAAALDEHAQTQELASKLYNTTVTPPAGAWSAIQSSLQEEIDEKVVPMRRKAPAFLKYAAAILVLATVGFGIIRFTSGNNINTTADAPPFADKDSATPAPEKTSKELAATAPQEDSFSNESAPTLLASIDKPAKHVLRNALKVDYADPEEEDYTSSSLADRYIMMMTPDGNFIRVSKKLSELVCCVTGEENNEQCNNQIKKWQAKIASAPIAPSPDNFMDILSLVNSLDEGIDL